MNYDAISRLWKDHANIDITNLAEESAKVPNLHAKFYDIYSKENIKLTQMELNHEKLYRLKNEYYSCRITDQDLKANGWEPFNLRLLKDDLKMYINSDQDIIDSLLKICIQREKTEFLKSIIDQINKRSFTIKNSIDFLKWSGGV